MLIKICQRCGRKIKQGSKCECGTARHQEYNAHCRDKSKNEFYHSRQWTKLVSQVKARANGLDEYALSEGRIEVGNTVHHIYPIEERPELKLSVENLIYVSAKSHNRIHREYGKGASAKQAMQNALLSITLKNRLKNEFR